MHESAEDIRRLQALLDTSYAAAGAHLKSIFRSPLDAASLVAALPGIFEMHLGTVTAAGAPFVAPIDGLFYRGDIWFGIPADAVRIGHIGREPRVSASYTRGEFCFIAHGRAVADPAKLQAFSAYSDAEYTKLYGDRWLEWRQRRREEAGDRPGFVGRIEASLLFAKS